MLDGLTQNIVHVKVRFGPGSRNGQKGAPGLTQIPKTEDKSWLPELWHESILTFDLNFCLLFQHSQTLNQQSVLLLEMEVFDWFVSEPWFNPGEDAKSLSKQAKGRKRTF